MYDSYLAATQHKEPHRLVKLLADRLSPRSRILDLGCGAGVDAEYLGRQGFLVTAVDREAASVAMVKERCRGLPVKVFQQTFEGLHLQTNHCDAVVSMLALPFAEKSRFAEILSDVREAVKPGGYAALAVFGMGDDWVSSGRVNGLEPSQLNWNGWETLELNHVSEDAAPAAGGPSKHWDILETLLRKRQ